MKAVRFIALVVLWSQFPICCWIALRLRRRARDRWLVEARVRFVTLGML